MAAADSTLAPTAQTGSDPGRLIRELSVSTQVMQRITDGVLSLVPNATFAAILRPEAD